MNYKIKIALVASVLSLPFFAAADDTAVIDETYSGAYHHQNDESLHIGNKAKHAKGSRDFDKADKNKDGTLTKKEAARLPHISKHFDEIDTDHDGSVDRDEVHRFMANVHEK